LKVLLTVLNKAYRHFAWRRTWNYAYCLQSL